MCRIANQEYNFMIFMVFVTQRTFIHPKKSRKAITYANLYKRFMHFQSILLHVTC